ncbi:MAG: TldD/PmbA family protein [Spirochaetales bacterium]
MHIKNLLNDAMNVAECAEWVGLRRRKSNANFYLARNAQFEQAIGSLDDGVMVEVLYKGSFGYAGTCDLSKAGIERATKNALACAKSAVGRGVHNFSPSVRPNTVIEYETKRLQSTAMPVNEIFECLIKSCESLKTSDEIIQTSSMIEAGQYDFEIVSSTGCQIEQSLYYVGTTLQAVAQRDNIVQIRSAGGPRGLTRQGGYELIDSAQLQIEAKNVGTQAIELLGAESCPNDRRTLVLMSDQLMLQIHESIGHPLELDRILGDERNYAGSSFIKQSDFGTFQYGSKLLNVTFDPTIQGELASYGVDEIGNLATKQFLIKDGVLLRGLGSLESQARTGLQGVACQRSTSWNRAPIDRMANLNIEPGESSFDEIISSTEKGILMHTNRSWSIDDYRNKFQFGCEYGQLIENGKITKTVRDPNYRGISSGFWRNLSKVGDSSTFKAYGTPNCGKGEPNQVIFVGHASPVCAFENVEVFGGGK